MKKLIERAIKFWKENIKKYIYMKLCTHFYEYLGEVGIDNYSKDYVYFFECSKCGHRMVIRTIKLSTKQDKILSLWEHGNIDIDFKQ